MSKRDFLVEIGTEELPPKSLFTLAAAFAEGVIKGLDTAAINHGEAKWFATPRRLAVYVAGVADQQPDQQIKRQGPAIANAFGPDGQPTKAALGFAASCGVTVDQLLQVDGPKGKVLQYRRLQTRRSHDLTTARHRDDGARQSADRAPHAVGRGLAGVRTPGSLGGDVVWLERRGS